MRSEASRRRDDRSQQEADARERRVERLEQADDARLQVEGGGLLQAGHDGDPLDPVAGASEHREEHATVSVWATDIPTYASPIAAVE